MDLLTVVRRSPIVFPLAFIAAAAMVFISEGSYWRSIGALDAMVATGAARTSIQELKQGLLDAETAQHDYFETGRNEFIRTFDGATRDVGEAFKTLDRLYGEEPKPKAVLAELHAATAELLDQLAVAIRRHDEGAGRATQGVGGGDVARSQTQAIRTLGSRLLEHEASSVGASREDLYRTLLLGRMGVAVLSGISLVAMFMFLRQSVALEAQRREQQRLVQSEHDRLEVEVHHRTEQLTELTLHLQTAREDERSRLARDLHDELGALLTSAKLDAARIKSRLAGAAPEALERLQHLVGTLESVIALKRRIIEDLRPSALAHLGLVATLEILAREFAERSGVRVHRTLAPVKLEAAAELMVYRLVQEAITNITKYAGASHVWLSLGSHDGQVEITVRDDGVGFDAGSKHRSAYGLVGMRFRVEAEHGTLSLDSAPGKGTTIRATLPESGSPTG
jgi:signal transduction histidine kinase